MSEHPILALIRGKVADPTRPFALLVDLVAQPGRGEQIAAAIAASQVVRLSRQEPGCLAYDLCRDAEASDRFVAFESWRDLAALRDHLASAHFGALGQALEGALAGAPTMRVLTRCA